MDTFIEKKRFISWGAKDKDLKGLRDKYKQRDSNCKWSRNKVRHTAKEIRRQGQGRNNNYKHRNINTDKELKQNKN